MAKKTRKIRTPKSYKRSGKLKSRQAKQRKR